MASTTDNGIIKKPSNHSVEKTVERLKNILEFKGITLFALVNHSGKGGNEHATHQTADFWQPQCRDASYDSCSQYGHRPTFKDSNLERWQGKSLGFVQQVCLHKGTTWFASGVVTKYRHHRNISFKGRG